ncbi:MAG: ribonuclease PH [Candidatus Aminicenantes bacterium]|nr:ribonuclease PH [Candidatus Aminicenantes bacterium]MDH5465857.1 ribonuclease PH [Candidatus Aminicenantes bacterium]MDH5704493.1 ribonuclease PH [Candidatus Aminicenantes bacterium]
MTRANKRPFDSIRPVKIKTDYLEFADGSALIEIGKTKVIAAASLDEKVPPFLKNSGTGWITAEYSMLPRSTEKRTIRERVQSRPSGRTQEIQRLIGRSLRAVTELSILGERTIILDCDVIQADGGTRTASITAACVALALALKKMMDMNVIKEMPLRHLVSAISVGIVEGEPLLDLDYDEDARADLDMNLVQTEKGHIVEIQATAERKTFSRRDLNKLMSLADKGIQELILIQKDVLKKKSLLFMAY